MAVTKIRALQWIADTVDDLSKISDEKMGTECHVIKEAAEYMLMSTGEWVRQTPVSGGGGGVTITDPIWNELNK